MRIGLILVVVVLIFAAFRALKTHFTCPQCGTNFKVSILNYIFASHVLGKRMAKCPNCGHTGMMTPKWDKK